MTFEVENGDGGPAFPSAYTHSDGRRFYEEGISVRDYIATHAGPGGTVNQVAGEIIAGRVMPSVEDIEAYLEFWFEVEAKLRYMRADAMLRERAK